MRAPHAPHATAHPRVPVAVAVAVAAVAVTIAAALVVGACPGPPRGGPRSSPDRPRARATDATSPAAQKLKRIHQRLLAAKKRGGTPTLASVLGSLARDVTEVQPCPAYLLTSHPVWRSVARLSGRSSAPQLASVLFFTTPYGGPPRQAPAKKRVLDGEAPVLLCAISVVPQNQKLEQQFVGSPFGQAAPRAKWLEFPPGHPVLEINSSHERSTNSNETVKTSKTLLLGFPRGRPTPLAEVLQETSADDAEKTTTDGRYHLVEHQGRYFVVEQSLTHTESNVQSPYRSPGPRTPGEWTLTSTLYELDPSTQVARELKGAALNQALALPPLKQFKSQTGRGTPPEL